MTTKTLSLRIDEDDYEFLSRFAKEEREDMSNTVRGLVNLGRVALAVEKYKKSEASIEKAARIAGVSITKMMDILAGYGVKANIDTEDYLTGLKSIREIW